MFDQAMQLVRYGGDSDAALVLEDLMGMVALSSIYALKMGVRVCVCACVCVCVCVCLCLCLCLCLGGRAGGGGWVGGWGGLEGAEQKSPSPVRRWRVLV